VQRADVGEQLEQPVLVVLRGGRAAGQLGGRRAHRGRVEIEAEQVRVQRGERGAARLSRFVGQFAEVEDVAVDRGGHHVAGDRVFTNAQ
jgi:hypothetical protein